MFLAVAILLVVLTHLMPIALVLIAGSLAWGAWLIATRPRAEAPIVRVPGPRRPTVRIPRQYSERDPLPEHRQSR